MHVIRSAWALSLAVLLVPPGTAAQPTSPTGALFARQEHTSAFEVGGIKVIHRYAPSSDVVAARLYLLGGTRHLSWENAGIEVLLLEASQRGTRTYPRDRLRRALARLGTTIETSAHHDWSVIGLRATRATLDSTWRILASQVMEPELDSGEVALVRQRLLVAARQRRDSPDLLLEFLADSFAFAGHPYAIPPAGTERSLARLTVDSLRNYHRQTLVKSRLLLVVVGNAERPWIERLVSGTLAFLPAGSYAWTLPDTLPRRPAGTLPVSRQLATNYILGLYPGPRADSPEYFALRIAAAILSGQLFGEIRSRRNLAYAVDAPFVERAVAAGGLYVTTLSPQLTVDLMRRQVEALRQGYVDRLGLEQLVRQFLTQYFMDNESAVEQADFLARAQLYQGDYRAALRFEANLRSVTPEDVQRAVQRYMRDVQFVYLGDTSRVPLSSMERF
jgi:zinc protease